MRIVVGQGAFGEVFQARKRGTLEIYATKVMGKDKILERNHAEYMKSEKEILTKVDHPFIVQLRYSFQVREHSFCAHSQSSYRWGGGNTLQFLTPCNRIAGPICWEQGQSSAEDYQGETEAPRVFVE
jgi:serine/threonine protein kinase